MAPVAKELSATCGVLEPLQTATSIDGEIEELHAAIYRQAKIPVTLIGHSWGAWLSFIFAARYPIAVHRLILVGTPPFLEKDTSRIMVTRLTRLTMGEMVEYRTLVKTLNNPSAGDKDPVFAQFGKLIGKADAFDPLPPEKTDVDFSFDLYKKIWKEAEILRREGDLLDLTKKIPCPVVAIHGDYDPHPAHGIQNPLSANLNTFRFVLLKNCGHRPWYEHSARDEFFKVLRSELKHK